MLSSLATFSMDDILYLVLVWKQKEYDFIKNFKCEQ